MALKCRAKKRKVVLLLVNEMIINNNDNVENIEKLLNGLDVYLQEKFQGSELIVKESGKGGNVFLSEDLTFVERYDIKNGVSYHNTNNELIVKCYGNTKEKCFMVRVLTTKQKENVERMLEMFDIETDFAQFDLNVMMCNATKVFE